MFKKVAFTMYPVKDVPRARKCLDRGGNSLLLHQLKAG
jgi:hypothetical protein